MSLYVVDASVAVKWFIPEKLSAEALRLYSSGTPLHAPVFLDIEVANILWKKRRRGEITRSGADFILSRLPLLPLNRHPNDVLLSPAFDLADQTQRTVYDCLYLALALHLGGQMVTADEKLVNSLAGTPWAGAILRLQDVPRDAFQTMTLSLPPDARLDCGLEKTAVTKKRKWNPKSGIDAGARGS